MPKFMKNINVISRCTVAFRGDRMKDSDLSPYHHGYILTLCRAPGLSQERLAQEMCINKSNVTRHLAALEENGYVERRRSEEDRRITLVYPTKKAYEILPRVRETVREWNAYLTEGMDAGELELFAAITARIAERAREYVNKDGEGKNEADT